MTTLALPLLTVAGGLFGLRTKRGLCPRDLVRREI